MERKLATIRRIQDIQSIEGADFIELVHINGWQCVSQKGNFKISDLGIYFEIDSFLPASKPQFAFLEKEFKMWKGKLGYRLRTKKLKKQISQGLLLPLSDFSSELRSIKIEEGTDVTELLGIGKWELDIKDSTSGGMGGLGLNRRFFPNFVPKTDEERVQNLPNVLTHLSKNLLFEVTEKLDGTSATYFYGGDKPEFGICSRNYWLKKPSIFSQVWFRTKGQIIPIRIWRITKSLLRTWWSDSQGIELQNSYWGIATKYKFMELLPKLDKQYAIQGEIIGPGIQNNQYKLKEQEFYIFNIYDIQDHRYLNPSERIELLISIQNDHNNSVKHVPILDQILLTNKFTELKDIIEYADGKSSINNKIRREGVVFKREDGKFSFKSISNEYLLKEE
jgi:RNA ligase (TIGR02306 family)